MEWSIDKMAIARLVGYDEFVDFITSNPTTKAVSEFRLSEATEAYIDTLLEANREGAITPDALEELDEYIRLKHLMRSAKIRAFEKLTRN
jgi:hypothetical protein